MGFAGYVTVCVRLYCVSCHCLTLHVSAYMAIFRCVGYFYFRMPKGICFGGFFFCLFLHVVTLCTFPCLFFLFCFSSLILLLFFCYESVSLGIEPLYDLWTDDQILLPAGSLLCERCCLVYGAPSLTRGRVCILQCNHSIVRVAQNP
jgi:hypothetical protein